MKQKGMTRRHAEEIAKSFQHLVGRPFGNAEHSAIECVTVAPYDPVYRYIFLTEYKDCGNATQALTIYPEDRFEVILIARLVSDKIEILQKDIRTYMNEQKEKLEAEKNCDRSTLVCSDISK